MPRGKPKGGHKGRMKHYLTAEEIAEQEDRKQRELDWKKKKGLISGATPDVPDADNMEDDVDDKLTMTSDEIRAMDRRKLEENDDDSDETDSSDDDDDLPKAKGVEGLIEIENPNRVKQKGRKVQDVDVNVKVELSRREREELEKQRDKVSYQKKHEAGLTDQAQRDLARLAIIRKQREEAALKKKEAEKAAAANVKK